MGNSLTKEERDVIESYNRDEWQSVSDFKKESQKYEEYAKATFRKDKRINIRISSKDLKTIQKRAMEEGLPYQTLISSILHKYVNGRLVEKLR